MSFGFSLGRGFEWGGLLDRPTDVDPEVSSLSITMTKDQEQI